MMPPQALTDGLTAHLAAALGVDSESADEMDGVEQMARAALDYFAGNVRGAPSGSGPALLWAIYSGLLNGAVPQERIDAFFSQVTLDFPGLIRNWPGQEGATLALLPTGINPLHLQKVVQDMSPEQRQKGITVALIPGGSLTDADISDVMQAIYKARAAGTLHGPLTAGTP